MRKKGKTPTAGLWIELLEPRSLDGTFRTYPCVMPSVRSIWVSSLFSKSVLQAQEEERKYTRTSWYRPADVANSPCTEGLKPGADVPMLPALQRQQKGREWRVRETLLFLPKELSQ